MKPMRTVERVGFLSDRSARPYVDIVIVVPLLEEFQRLEKSFRSLDQTVRGMNVITRLDVGNPELSVVAVLQHEQGKTAAIRATEQALADYEAGLVIVLGIAGGLDGEAAIGDICITGTVIDVLDNAKVSEDEDGQDIIDFDPTFYKTDDYLNFSMFYAKIGADVRPAYEDWQLEQYDAGSKIVPGEYVGRGEKNEKIGLPDLHSGTIICGYVSQSAKYAKRFKQVDRKVLAIETEAGGVFYSALRNGVPAISVRGISDYADANKKLLEEQTRGKARTIAADNAVAFLRMQLSNPQLLLFLSSRRESSTFQELLLGEADEEATFAHVTLAEARGAIHRQLTQLSPEYHGKPEGYRLPLPRVRMSPSNVSVGPASARQTPSASSRQSPKTK
jgi:nucleoside phosphorylase